MVVKADKRTQYEAPKLPPEPAALNCVAAMRADGNFLTGLALHITDMHQAKPDLTGAAPRETLGAGITVARIFATTATAGAASIVTTAIFTFDAPDFFLHGTIGGKADFTALLQFVEAIAAGIHSLDVDFGFAQSLGGRSRVCVVFVHRREMASITNGMKKLCDLGNRQNARRTVR